jgi:hypothetical protein
LKDLESSRLSVNRLYKLTSGADRPVKANQEGGWLKILVFRRGLQKCIFVGRVSTLSDKIEIVRPNASNIYLSPGS